jgi:hypothetical protein
MVLLVILGLLLLGAVIGGAGVGRLGRWAGQAAGRWRPGVGMGAVLLAFVGLALSARGAWVVGLPALIAAAGFALAARRRRSAVSTETSRSDRGLSEAEARALLGVEAGAGEADIRAAYARLITRVHPDRGGAVGLAAQLNAARDRLLG